MKMKFLHLNFKIKIIQDVYTKKYRFIGLVVRVLPMVFETGVQSRSSHTEHSMVLDPSLFNTQHYKVRIKGKVERSRERSRDLPYTSVWQLLKREHSITTTQKITGPPA